jgi:membrane associated rhomboid family serine protease
MLSDRPYLRHDYPRARTSVLTWLLCAIAGGFLMQLVLGSQWFGSQLELENQFGLSIHGLRQGWIWTLVTHGFLHDTGFLFHAVGVGLLLYFIGGELLPLLGPQRFLGLYFGAIVAGGLAWTAAHWQLGGTHLGAMAAVDAMLVVFACFYPNRQMDFLLFFVLPVRVRPKHLVLFLLGIDLIGLIAYELLGAARPFEQLRLDHSAHLGGMLAGWIYYQFVHEARWRTATHAKSAEWTEQVEPVDAPSGSGAAPHRDLRAEVNRILDKINSHGFASLTPQEKRVLDEAKDSLSRR